MCVLIIWFVQITRIGKIEALTRYQTKKRSVIKLLMINDSNATIKEGGIRPK